MSTVSENASVDRAETRREIARRLAAAKTIVLLTHDRPDGDGLGAMMALAAAARRQGKTALPACSDRVPGRYAFLTAGENLLDAAALAEAVKTCDCLVVLDTCTMNQLESVAAVVTAAGEKAVVIDHHQTAEPIAPLRWCDPSAAAAGVMVAELLAELDWPITPPVAEALLAAVGTDTGWFRFANTDSRALAVAGRCLDAGASADAMCRRLYQNDRPQRLALKARALAGLQLHYDGRVAVMTLAADDFAATGAAPAETEDLINEPMHIADVCVSILLVAADDRTRVSLRSKPTGAPPTGTPIDVARVARALGGGGHARAAGARLTATLAQATQTVLAAIANAGGWAVR